MIPFAGRFSDGSLYHLEHKPLTGTGGTGSFAEVCDGVFAVHDFSLRRGNAWVGAIFEKRVCKKYLLRWANEYGA